MYTEAIHTKLFSLIALVALVMGAIPLQASAATGTVWEQGFEEHTDGWIDSNNGWYGVAERVSSGTNGIDSAEGDWHAIFTQSDETGPFSRFDNYRDSWSGPWTAEVAVYLDPALMDPGEGFDYSVAATHDGGGHLRDFIFHVTKDTSTGDLLIGGSNNTNFDPREDLENHNHYRVTEAGWYTLQHAFYDDGGVLAADLNLLDVDNNLLFTETRSQGSDTIPGVVGGNRYAWFTNIDVDGGIAVDSHSLVITLPDPASKLDCQMDWEMYGFKNQGQCVRFIETGKDSR